MMKRLGNASRSLPLSRCCRFSTRGDLRPRLVQQRQRTTHADLVHQPRQRRPGRAAPSSAPTAPAGAYRIETSLLPNDAAAQREQLVRRLAAKDTSIDIMSLDPPFVAEFASAGFLRPFTADDVASGFTDGVLAGPVEGATWDGKLVAAPFWANTQLLWYRKSVAPGGRPRPGQRPGHLGPDHRRRPRRPGKTRRRPGHRATRATWCWINALVASAGGQILEHPEAPADDVTPGARHRRRPARPPEVIGDARPIPGRRPRPVHRRRGGGPGRSSRATGAGSWSTGPTSTAPPRRRCVEAARSTRRVLDDIGWARYPQVDAGPSQPPAARRHRPRHRRLHQAPRPGRRRRPVHHHAPRASAATCVVEGNPAARAAVYDDPEVREAFPMADLIRESIERRRAPAPDAVLHRRVHRRCSRTFHPPARVDPDVTPTDADRPRSSACSDGEAAAVTTRRRPDAASLRRRPPPQGRAAATAPKAERRLGWLLVGPGFVVMLAVTAYPIAQALSRLSLYSYRLTDPAGREFVGLSNYGVVLTDPLWWQATWSPPSSSPSSPWSSSWSSASRFALVMHRHRLRRAGCVRTAILVPYGIITVVSAFAWRYAFALDTGFVNQLVRARATSTGSGSGARPCSSSCLSEIWKTTPFMSLLLLAGLAQVPDELLEAAEVDGATWWQRLWRVTLPNMKAAIMVAVLFRTLDAYRIFDNVFVMTNGANGTETVSFLAYRQTISRHRPRPRLGGLRAAVRSRVRADRRGVRQGLQGRPRPGARGAA